VLQIGLPLSSAAFCPCTRIFPKKEARGTQLGASRKKVSFKSIKSMLDLICLHLSDPLFDLVLKLVYDYVTTNSKSNAVKAIGQLISSLALAHPVKTIDKFLPSAYHRSRKS
jgi:proteasome activator subunit 4